MDLDKIIKSPKIVHDWGEWRDAPLRFKVFQLNRTKSGSLPIARKARWRLVKFYCLSQEFELVVSYESRKLNYSGSLGQVIKLDNKVIDTRLIAVIENHGTHPGWHFHRSDRCIEELPIGRSARTKEYFDRIETSLECNGLSFAKLVCDESMLLEPVLEAFGLNRVEGGLFDEV